MDNLSEQKNDNIDQYLSFMLDKEIFAVEISKVREVLDFTKITRVPRMPEFLRGVINLRGRVITVVDLRRKLGFDTIDQTRKTCIIIVEVNIDNLNSTLGLLADSVREVFEISSDSIEPPPRMGLKLDTKFIKGMGKQGEDFIIILDIDLVLSSSDKAVIAAAAEMDYQDSKENPEEEPPPEAVFPAKAEISDRDRPRIGL